VAKANIIFQSYYNSWINSTAIDKKHIQSAFIAAHFSKLKKLKADDGFSHIIKFICDRCG